MIKTNRELHDLVNCFVDSWNSKDTIDTYNQTPWFDLIIEIYRSEFSLSASQFTDLLVTGGLSKADAWQASVEYSYACELLKNYEDRVNEPAH